MQQDTVLIKKKSVVLLNTENKWAEKAIRETTSFTIVTNYIRYLGVTLTKQDPQSLKKEIKEDIRKWKDLPCSWIGRLTQ